MRGAFVLGALLAAILFLAVAVSFRIYTQLEGAARVQRTLIEAQQRLDAVLRVQLDAEAGLRGYLATGRKLFLAGEGRGDEFETRLAAFESTTADLGIPAMAGAVAEMRSLHESWNREVELPLLARPRAPDAVARQTNGKILLDRLSGDTSRIHDLLEARLLLAQEELRRRINEGLFGGLVAALIFGVVSISFVLSRAQMLAVIDREREIVETLEGAFRTDLAVLPGSRIGTAYVSADRDAAVGGDLYDVRRLDATRGLVIVADVSGKGISAAVNTAFVKYSIRALALAHDDPGVLLEHFNRLFLETVADPNLFVVAFVGVLDPGAGTLRYASAGHGGAYLRRGGGVRRLEVTGPVVGLDRSFTYASASLALERGDLLLLATDGLTEARDAAGALLDDAGAMTLLAAADSDPQRCADELVAAVRSRNGGSVRDDLALLVISIEPPEAT